MLLWIVYFTLIGFLALCVFALHKYLRIIINLFLEISVKASPESLDGLRGERLNLTTGDGVSLAAIFSRAHQEHPIGTIIFLHEYGSDLRSAERYAGFLLDAGFNVLAFDFRGHGQSQCPVDFTPRQWITEAEVNDVLAAVDYVSGRQGPTKIGLFGISRGGVAAVLAAARDGRISAVLTDGAFSTSGTVLEYILRWVSIFAVGRIIYKNLPLWFYRALANLAIWISEIRLALRFPSLDRALIRRKAPLFMIHGLQDAYIDYRQANRLYGLASEPKELWLVPGAGHNESVLVRPEEYANRVIEFFTRELSHAKPTPAEDVARREDSGR